MSKLDFERARDRDEGRAAARRGKRRKRRTIRVHPNSTAARRWGRTTWDTDA